jgi:hypothetical protein
MSVSKATDSDRKSGVAVIKAEYVFMYLNCLNYNIHVCYLDVINLNLNRKVRSHDCL